MNNISFDKARQAWSLPWDAEWVTAVRFVGTGRKLAAGNNLGEILVWDLPEKDGGAAPMPVLRLDGHTNCISRLEATSDGRYLISASWDHDIRIWDMQAETRETATVVLNARQRERARPGQRVPAAIEARVRVLATSQRLTGHDDWVTSMALSRDGKTLLSGDDEGLVLLRDREKGAERKRWRARGWAYAVALSPDDKQAFVSERVPLVFDSGRHDGARFWNCSTGQTERDADPALKGKHIAAAAYSPDGKLLAAGRGGEADGLSGVVYLLDPGSGKLVRTLSPGHLNGLTDLTFHRDGRHLATCGRDTTVRIWNTADGKMVKQLGQPRGGQFKDWLHSVSFSADGRWIAAGDMAGAVLVWALSEG